MDSPESHLTLSNITLDQLREGCSLAAVVPVQNRYNREDQASEPVLQECERREIAFIPRYPLASGRIAQAPSEHRTATPAQVAIAWLLAKSPVMLPIPGTSSLAHLEENIEAASLRLE